MLSTEESNELIRLVAAEPGTDCRLDPQHALVLYALRLIAPIEGDRAKGYAPTKEGINLALKLAKNSLPKRPASPGPAPDPHRNTDPYWPFPIRIR